MTGHPEASRPTYLTETRHSKASKTCHHFYHHGLTCDRYDQLQARAGGRCELCTAPAEETSGRRLVLDHIIRQPLYLIRGLICDRCNTVMACVDGRKPWGANRRWEHLARHYAEAEIWEIPLSEVPRLAGYLRRPSGYVLPH